MSLTSRMQALLTYANETTGAADTTLGDAVHTLADGYGGSETVTFQLSITADVTAQYTIPLNYGRAPKRVEIYSNAADVFTGGVVPNNTTITALYYSTELLLKSYRAVSTALADSYSAVLLSSTNSGHIKSVSSTAIVLATASTRRLDKRLTYTVKLEF